MLCCRSTMAQLSLMLLCTADYRVQWSTTWYWATATLNHMKGAYLIMLRVQWRHHWPMLDSWWFLMLLLIHAWLFHCTWLPTPAHQFNQKFLELSCTSLYKTKKPGRHKTCKPCCFGGNSELHFSCLLKNKPEQARKQPHAHHLSVATTDSHISSYPQTRN